MNRPTYCPQRGLTLIEALIAAVVLAIGLLALLRVPPELRRQAELARHRSEAVRLAQTDIEGLRGAVSLAAHAAIADAAYSVEPDGLGSPRYALERRVDAVTWPQARGIDVTVRWSDRRGEAQQVMLSTLIAAHEPALAAQRLLPR
jgi:prepilin-type N-terminal cleavage/methylation domain-containing protein